MATKLHQALHGYSDGHRELASSLSLSPKESRLVLVMSDVSGPGVAAGGTSYVSGYPLPEAGVYAIAKTWPAPEMSRPGCVWTHTFFLDFADLASLDSPSRIAKYFCRPSFEGWPQYGKPLQVDFEECEEPSIMGAAELEWLGRTLNALYNAPRERVLARRDSSIPVEQLVLSAWDQQWPRLRRSFRFCTLTTKDRSNEGAAFDLQVAPGLESGVRARVPGTLEATEVTDASVSRWLTGLLADVQEPNVSGLRSSLRVLGADILGGREAMRALCEFHELTAPKHDVSSVDLAVSLVTEPQPLAGSRVANARVVQLALDHLADLGESSLQYLMEHLPLMDSASLDTKTQELAMVVWERQPQKLFAMLDDEDDGVFARRALQSLPTKSLIDGWSRVGTSIEVLLHVRPDLLEDPSFWSATQCPPSVLVANGAQLSIEPIILAMLQGLEEESAIASAVETIGSRTILNALQALLVRGVGVSSERHWIKYSCTPTSVVAGFLSELSEPSEHLLKLICDELPPDAIPNDYGHDPWSIALGRLRDVQGSLPVRLCAYGFRRAVGWRSRSIGELLQLTFEPLHNAAANSVLDEASWSLIVERLPWVPAQRSWDKCLRLRQAVAKEFVDRHLWAKSFAQIASNDDVFCLLMEEVLDQWGGRRYLREVEDSLRNERDAAASARRALIREFLRANKRKW